MIDKNYELVKQIFLQAIEVEPDKQYEFVSELLAGDKELISEVMILLDNNLEETLVNESQEPVSKKVRVKANLKKGLLASLLKSENQVKIGVVISFFFLFIVGFWTYQQIIETVKESKKEQLHTLLEADIKAVDIWVNQNKRDIETWAANDELISCTEKLLSHGQGFAMLHPDTLRNDDCQDDLAELLEEYIKVNQVVNFTVFDRTGTLIASGKKDGIGVTLKPSGIKHIAEVLEGGALFTPPSVPEDWVNGVKNKEQRTKIWFDAPILNKEGIAIGVLGIGLYADQEFNEILKIARLGNSGETYVFSNEGLMLSPSRYSSEIKRAKIQEYQNIDSSLNKLFLKAPPFDITKKEITKEEYDLARVSKIIEDCFITMSDTLTFGAVLDPYKNYVGKDVVGAYVWVPDYNMGFVSEISTEEAFKAIDLLKLAFSLIFGLLLIAAGYAVFSSFSIVKLNEQVDDAEKLGQYSLVKKIGEGGMGQVYLAKHALLKRPTVIKFLKKEIANANNIARFEKEVQLASLLTHPNTIRIYDYGVTPDHTFYYAMEYLDGVHLADLIKLEHQVALPRVLYILKHICFSLREAHLQGIIHRDIKPMNVMLCFIGCEYDFVKVLDFGLVKDLNDVETEVTQLNQLTGTPVYMAPERITDPENVDARSDIYSLGVLAYYLLSGRTVFKGENIIEQVIGTEPKPLKEWRPDLSEEVCELIHTCLNKNPRERPVSVDRLIELIDNLNVETVWDQKLARKWWKENV